MWIFDQSDGSARLLKQRQGHSAPPTHVKFYTAGGLGLLSAGKLRRCGCMARQACHVWACGILRPVSLFWGVAKGILSLAEKGKLFSAVLDLNLHVVAQDG